MIEIIPGQIYRNKSNPEIKKLCSELKLFPTPFKRIWYSPYETERKGFYITDPLKVLFQACGNYLGTKEYYYGLSTAEYLQNKRWQYSEAHIINRMLSRIIERKLPKGNYWRAKAIRKIMSSYPSRIRIHRLNDFTMEGTKKIGILIFSGAKKTEKDRRIIRIREK